MNVNLDQVRLRAYELWLRDGMADGRDWEHWHAAECELRNMTVSATASAAKPAATKRKAKSAKAKM
jgi:Protein of unknown function (DUF2934)